MSRLQNRRPDSRSPQDLQRRTVRWVVSLFAVVVLTQRFAAPGFPVVPLLLPLVFAWCAWGLALGLTQVDRRRLVLWLLAVGASALVVLPQLLWVANARVSVASWALFMATWAPFVLRLSERGSDTYLACLRGIVAVGCVLAAGCLLMMGSQLAGLAYRDLLAQVVPSQFLLQDFIITYPVTYGSPLYRANAWIGLEPSMVSVQLGLTLLAGALARVRARWMLLMASGLLASAAGSGIAVLVVGAAVIAVSPARRQLRPYVPAAVAAVGAAVISPWGPSLLSRLTEIRTSQSSTSLRATLPYEYLWPTWSTDWVGVVLGFGPGSSQKIVAESGILGLLVPTPIKIFFDYGVLAGLVIAAFMAFCYLEGQSRSIAFALFTSLWLLQPGATTMVILAPLLILVTLWAPRTSWWAIEDAPRDDGFAAGSAGSDPPRAPGVPAAAGAPG